jgi:hypothetical protein
LNQFLPFPFSVGVFFVEMAEKSPNAGHEIRRKLRARYGHSISDQEVELIASMHARHGAVKV